MGRGPGAAGAISTGAQADNRNEPLVLIRERKDYTSP